jgi:anti-sigma factor RsiW
MSMKTFEEKWTAWLDGELSGKELAEFEASLPDRTAAEAEKRDARKLGVLLKQELGTDVLSNEEFFSHQIRDRIAREDITQGRPAFAWLRRGKHRERSTWWTVRRLALTGAVSMALFVICALFVMRDKNPAEQSQYLTQILKARVDPAVSPNASISMFETKEDKVTVLWVEGLQSLPADYAAK